MIPVEDPMFFSHYFVSETSVEFGWGILLHSQWLETKLTRTGITGISIVLFTIRVTLVRVYCIAVVRETTFSNTNPEIYYFILIQDCCIIWIPAPCPGNNFLFVSLMVNVSRIFNYCKCNPFLVGKLSVDVSDQDPALVLMQSVALHFLSL